MFQTGFSVELVGGRYDGAVVPCTAAQARSAVLLLVDESEPDSEGQQLQDDAFTTECGRSAYFYFQRDLKGDSPDGYDGEGVYHRCADDLWRPAKTKAALGL